MRPRRPRTPRTPRTLGTTRRRAPRYLSPTLASSFPNTSSRRYLAGSQRRRRGRTALVRSWHSALDNQRTEGRAFLILGSASEARARERACLATTRGCTSDGSRVQKPTPGLVQVCTSQNT